MGANKYILSENRKNRETNNKWRILILLILSTVLTGHFHFKRLMGFAVMQIYIPTVCVVIVSWISLWVKRTSVPAVRFPHSLFSNLKVGSQMKKWSPWTRTKWSAPNLDDSDYTVRYLHCNTFCGAKVLWRPRPVLRSKGETPGPMTHEWPNEWIVLYNYQSLTKYRVIQNLHPLRKKVRDDLVLIWPE